ncbi:MAG: hypothetical protein ACUVXD_06955 [Thermodesulfobacteriota bacterium]
MSPPELGDEAFAKGHTTMDDATNAASRAGLRPPSLCTSALRYDNEGDMKLLAEADSRMFDRAQIGIGLGVYPVP